MHVNVLRLFAKRIISAEEFKGANYITSNHNLLPTHLVNLRYIIEFYGTVYVSYRTIYTQLYHQRT